MDQENDLNNIKDLSEENQSLRSKLSDLEYELDSERKQTELHKKDAIGQQLKKKIFEESVEQRDRKIFHLSDELNLVKNNLHNMIDHFDELNEDHKNLNEKCSLLENEKYELTKI